jgi:hypothetical protein
MLVAGTQTWSFVVVCRQNGNLPQQTTVVFPLRGRPVAATSVTRMARRRKIFRSSLKNANPVGQMMVRNKDMQ